MYIKFFLTSEKNKQNKIIFRLCRWETFFLTHYFGVKDGFMEVFCCLMLEEGRNRENKKRTIPHNNFGWLIISWKFAKILQCRSSQNFPLSGFSHLSICRCKNTMAMNVLALQNVLFHFSLHFAFYHQNPPKMY